MALDADAIDALIDGIAEGDKSIASGDRSVTAHDLRELIELHKYRTRQNGANTNMGGMRFAKTIPPGCG
jgi:hypothetical protein